MLIHPTEWLLAVIRGLNFFHTFYTVICAHQLQLYADS
jgi:hypothetical protein